MRIRLIAGVAAALAAAPLGTAAAQTLGTPVFLAPYRAFQRSEIGASFSDPGHGIAVEGHYRIAYRSNDLGFRLGIRDHDPGDSHLLLGVDWRSSMVTHSDDFPLDGSLTLGAGLILADGNTQLLLPVGFSLGRRIALEDSEVQLTPYMHPVLALSIGDDSDLIFGLGLGLDIRITRRFEVRVAGALGDYEGVSVGVSFLR
jgi:hypothetical protein